MAKPVFKELLRAELHHMAENEMVIHLEDVLRRRTPLALTQYRARLRCDAGLKETAKILFGKNADAEIDRYFG